MAVTDLPAPIAQELNAFTEAAKLAFGEHLPIECDAVCRIDRAGLELASASFAHKRQYARRRLLTTRLLCWVRDLIRS
jgi:hypothetical protein